MFTQFVLIFWSECSIYQEKLFHLISSLSLHISIILLLQAIKGKVIFFTSVIRAPLWHFVFIDTFPSAERSEEGKREKLGGEERGGGGWGGGGGGGGGVLSHYLVWRATWAKDSHLFPNRPGDPRLITGQLFPNGPQSPNTLHTSRGQERDEMKLPPPPPSPSARPAPLSSV